MLLKALVTALLIVATTLGLGNNTSMQDTDL